jgi:hypothetical protein
MIGSTLSALAAFAFLALGAGSFVAPQALAKNYGIPADGPEAVAYLRAIGARDAVLGLLIAAFLARREPASLAVVLACSALAGASDFGLVGGLRGRSATPSLLLHASGTVGLLAIAALVRVER